MKVGGPVPRLHQNDGGEPGRGLCSLVLTLVGELHVQ